MKYLLIYLLIINALGFVLMTADKHRAKNHLWRIPERVLLLTAAAGGSAGCLAGMYTSHHKTRKPKFSLGVPALLALHIALGAWLLIG